MEYCGGGSMQDIYHSKLPVLYWWLLICQVVA